MSKNPTQLPPLEWVRVFEAAARTQNFTAAAKEIGLTQAAVSQRMRNLEAMIGAQLFDRNPRGVSLTVEGEAWLPYVTSALDTLRHSTAELFEKPLKKIALTASSTIIQLWIAPRLALIEERANYQISLRTMNTEPDFSKTDAEIEIRYGVGAVAGKWQGRRAAKLFDEQLSPLVSPTLIPVNKASKQTFDWQNLPRIAVSGPRPGWQQWALETKSDAPPVPVLRFDSFASALAAAQSGAGVLLASLPLCQAAIGGGSLVRVSPDAIEPDAGYWLTSKPTKLPQKQWQSLVEVFCQT